MIRKITAAVLAAALLIGPFDARPAQALDEKELLGILAGVAAVAIIKKELDGRKDERQAAEVRRQQSQRYEQERGHHQRVLPADCSFRLEDRRGRIRDVIGPRCLERNGYRLSRLPNQCLTEVRTTRGWRNAYAVRCLERKGWLVSDQRSASARRDSPRYDESQSTHVRLLPGQCLYRLEGRDGRLQDVVGSRCLDQNGVRLANLPGACLRDVRTNHGWTDAYSLRCLKAEGWELDTTRRIGN